jgi:prolyl-tRNA synthetase
VVVPIPYKEQADPVNARAEEVAQRLRESGLRVHADMRDLRPGRKFYDWERHGVPLRIEIGPEDLRRNCVIAVRRDTGEHITIPGEKLVEEVKRVLADIESSLKENAWKRFSGRILEAGSVEDVKRLAEEGNIVRVAWCGEESCGMKVEEPSGGKVLGEELENRPSDRKCLICSRDANSWLLVAKSY